MYFKRCVAIIPVTFPEIREREREGEYFLFSLNVLKKCGLIVEMGMVGGGF